VRGGRRSPDQALARNPAQRRANRGVKQLMLDHAFTFVDTIIFWVGDEN
jgi:hypothetical protein